MDFWHDAAAQARWLRRFILFLLILLLPAAVVAFYARPSADDYVYAARTHAVVQQYGFDLPRLLKAAWETTVYFFQNWQGLYVSGFVLALQPAIFGNRWYGLTFLCVLVPMFLCLYGCIKLLVFRLEPAQKRMPLALSALLLFAFVEGMPSPVEGLYWFNGAMNYLPYFSLTVLNMGLAVTLCTPQRLSVKRQYSMMIASVAIGLIIGGGHQVVGELNLLLLLFLTVVSVRNRNFRLCPALAAAFLGLLINVTAPGTQVRSGGLAGAGLGEAIVKSFLLALMQWIRWLDVPLLCLLVLLALPLHHLAQSKAVSDRLFRFPWAGPAGTFVLMWAMIFLPSYTMGGIGAGRLLNVVWMTFVLGLMVSEFLFLGWTERIQGTSLSHFERFLEKRSSIVAGVMASMLVCMACIGSHTVKEGQDNYFATSLEAVYELASGKAPAFARALDEREALLNDSSQPDVAITPLSEEEYAWLLYYTDVSVGPDRWGLTPYYQKDSVVVVAKE